MSWKMPKKCYNINRKTTAHKVGCPIGIDGNSALSLGQSVRADFLCNSYFLVFNTMNVSNAIMNIPKDIKSWKENSSIDITSIHREWRQHHPANTVVINYYSTKKWIKQHLFTNKNAPVRRGDCGNHCSQRWGVCLLYRVIIIISDYVYEANPWYFSLILLRKGVPCRSSPRVFL